MMARKLSRFGRKLKTCPLLKDLALTKTISRIFDKMVAETTKGVGHCVHNF